MKHENKLTYESKISIAEARKAIGMTHRNYSDEQIQEIINIMVEGAELGYEEYLKGNQGE